MPRKSDIRPHILSSSQLAERLGISKRTLDRWIKDGRIPEPNRNPHNDWRFWTMQEAIEIEESLGEE
jgi:predicted site-specific integrase-resolvase